MTDIIRPGETVPAGPHFIALEDTMWVVDREDDGLRVSRPRPGELGGGLHLFRTPQEVIAFLVPDYLTRGAGSDRAAFVARHELARAFIVAGHEALDLDVARLSEAERMALSARGARAVTDVEVWEPQVPTPLYVLATLHAPYTDTPLPRGRDVYPVDPYTELSLVTSLADAGLLRACLVEPGQVWEEREW